MFKKIVSILILFFVISSTSYAGEATGFRKITEIGCHVTDGTCYVTLTGNAYGDSEKCSLGAGTQFRFDGSTSIGHIDLTVSQIIQKGNDMKKNVFLFYLSISWNTICKCRISLCERNTH